MRVLFCQISTSCRNPDPDAARELGRDLVGVHVVDARQLLHDRAPLQPERVRRDRVVAVDQHRLDLDALVVVPQVVDHVRRPVVRRLRTYLHVTGVVRAHRDVRPPARRQVLGRDMAFEHVLEVRREREVDVEEVRHVDGVVDDLTAVRVLDHHRVPRPVAPLAAERGVDARDRDVLRRRVALRVVPHEELLVLLQCDPRPGAGPQRNPFGVRDLDTLAVAAPAPVVERARDRVALHRALGEVAAHVPAVSVEHVELAVVGREHHELRAERLDRVRGAVAEVGGQAEAVPAAGEPRRRSAGVDRPHTVLRHRVPPEMSSPAR